MQKSTQELCQPPLFEGARHDPENPLFVESLVESFLEDGFELFVSRTDALLVMAEPETCPNGCGEAEGRLLPIGFRSSALGYRAFSFCSSCSLVVAEY